MKVLFYSTYHFNTEVFGPYLENIQKHINNGDEVYFVNCNADIASCQINPSHQYVHCKACIDFRENGMNCISGKVNYISLKQAIQKCEIDYNKIRTKFTSIEDLKSLYIDNFDIGIAVLSSVVSILRNPSPSLDLNSKLIEKQIIASAEVFYAIQSIINENKIDLVYVFNARFATLRACLRACEKLTIHCNVLEEGKDRGHYSIFENSMPHSAMYYHQKIEEKWKNGGLDKANIAMQYYIDRSESKNARVSMFTAHQTKGKLPENWEDKNQNIVIFNSSEDEFVAIGDEWKNPIYQSQAEGVKKICESLLNQDNFKVFLRIHPNLNGVWNKSVEDLYKLRYKNLSIIPADDDISSYELMKKASKIITFGSSVGIEAAAFGIPSILAGMSFYRNLGSTYNPANHDELIQLVLNTNLPALDKEGALKYAYFLHDFGIPYQYFERLNTFKATMNGKTFSSNFFMYWIRQFGRKIRLYNESKTKSKNIEKAHQLLR